MVVIAVLALIRGVRREVARRQVAVTTGSIYGTRTHTHLDYERTDANSAFHPFRGYDAVWTMGSGACLVLRFKGRPVLSD